MDFFVQKEDMKKALSVVALATDESADHIWGHALFKIDGDNLKLYSTNKDKIAFGTCSVSKMEGDPEEFTADPKKVTALLSSSDMEVIRFNYKKEENTLNVYASENKNAYLSFASFEPDKFLSFESKLKTASNIATINAGIFLSGLKFIQGFLPPDDRNQKFARMYVEKGVMYGSNASNKIGAYLSPALEGLDGLIVRRPLLSSLCQMIDKINPTDINVKDANKHIIVMTPDDSFGFGFLKTTDNMIKFPISIQKPDTDAFTIDRNLFLKKLNRLAITSGNELGIKMKLRSTDIEMNTILERSSVENIDVHRFIGKDDVEFIVDYRLAKAILGLYQASNLDIFVDKSKYTIWSEAELEIQEENKEITKKSFTAIGLVSLAREVE